MYYSNKLFSHTKKIVSLCVLLLISPANPSTTASAASWLCVYVAG